MFASVIKTSVAIFGEGRKKCCFTVVPNKWKNKISKFHNSDPEKDFRK